MTVKIQSKLPDPDTENNGLGPRAAEIVAHPQDTVLVVALMRCETIEHKPHTGARIPVMLITAVELLSGGEEQVGMALLQEARERRTGQAELRYDRSPREDVLFDGRDGRLGSTELTRTGQGDHTVAPD